MANSPPSTTDITFSNIFKKKKKKEREKIYSNTGSSVSSYPHPFPGSKGEEASPPTRGPSPHGPQGQAPSPCLRQRGSPRLPPPTPERFTETKHPRAEGEKPQAPGPARASPRSLLSFSRSPGGPTQALTPPARPSGPTPHRQPSSSSGGKEGDEALHPLNPRAPRGEARGRPGAERTCPPSSFSGPLLLPSPPRPGPGPASLGPPPPPPVPCSTRRTGCSQATSGYPGAGPARNYPPRPRSPCYRASRAPTPAPPPPSWVCGAAFPPPPTPARLPGPLHLQRLTPRGSRRLARGGRSGWNAGDVGMTGER